MSWIQTYTGRRFYPLSPDPKEVVIKDIARALAMQCRFNGHVQRFYSVAEHCVLASILAPEAFALEALLHDAPEAYVGDMVRPLKDLAMLFDEDADNGHWEWREVEDGIHQAIARAFNIPAVPAPVIKEIDLALLMAEREQLMGTPPQPWATERIKPAAVTLHCWNPERAERQFLGRFYELRKGKE